ncbi:metallophosphoesterase family protein [Pseudonocardia sp. HH130630-07]|uniref:metallophosphoesterase family protein n=1 Tax=Pseudonocardia sp. HH130630-07 TaxID=1690815 RepID=UPI001E368666|nr:metallophosphoesterase family protein [Pseudonocardia sp. HH130630-07]
MLAAAGGLGALAAGVRSGTAAASPRPGTGVVAGRLRFAPDGTFRVVQFNDTQDDERTDVRTVQLIERTLDAEKPGLVVVNGDVITEGCEGRQQVKQAINNVVWPMESRAIPWALTFGNHDEDSPAAEEPDMLRFCRTYAHNVNADEQPGPTGTGNGVVEIAAPQGDRAAYAVWLIDAGRYAPERIAGQDIEGYPHWDWVRGDQVGWYREQSAALAERHGGPVPGLMFLHIPLWEFRFMWWGGVDTRTEESAARGRARHRIVGERNEDECPGPFNSGLFSAICERGDVHGVFAGHDHVNTYCGDYYGIRLGYGPGTGFGAYGLDGPDRNRLRGARVFDLAVEGDTVRMETRLVFAKDLGIDLTADDRPGDPRPLAPPQENA